MNWRQGMWFFAAIAAAVMVGGLVTSKLDAQNNTPRAVKIAVVDIEEVFNNLKEREEVQAQIQGKIEKLQQFEDAKKKEIAGWQNDLLTNREGTPEWNDLNNKIQRGLTELQVELQLGQRRLAQESARQLEALYRKIIDGTSTIAKQNGYDMVLLQDKMPNLTGANQQQIAAMIQVRKLLYAADDLNITEQVKQRLNNDFVNN